MATAHQTTRRLPSPLERPDADVVIFDGQCRLCRGQIERLARWDTGGRLAFVSLHDPLVAERYPDLTHDQLMANMYLVDRRGRRYKGAEAIRYLSGKLPWLWWLAPLLYLPGTLGLWQFLYRQVANRRYLFGKLETCDDAACSLHR